MPARLLTNTKETAFRAAIATNSHGIVWRWQFRSVASAPGLLPGPSARYDTAWEEAATTAEYMYRKSPHFANGAAGKGKGKKGETVFKVGTPKSNRAKAPAPPFDFSASQDDGDSSDELPTRLTSSKAAPESSDDDDGLDVIGPNEEPRAGPPTTRATASLRDNPVSVSRARTRLPSHLITASASVAAPNHVEIISSDEGEKESAQSGMRMKSPNGTRLPDVGNARRFTAEKVETNNPGPRPITPIRNKGPTAQTALKSGMRQIPSTQSLRRSTRNSRRSNLCDHVPVPDPDEVILIYPPNGRGSVNITNGDLGRLAPGDYLNDSLIELGLKVWLNGLREHQPELAEQIHLFSSFFYKKLGSNVEEGYSAVRNWTSKFDIFKKKYIVIPINEDFHWYLAIVYEPGRVLQPPPSTRMKGDINLAESQASIVEQQHGVELGDATPPESGATQGLRESLTAGDASEEMEVDQTPASSFPLTKAEADQLTDNEDNDPDLDLFLSRFSSPSDCSDVDMSSDVEMTDISGQAQPMSDVLDKGWLSSLGNGVSAITEPVPVTHFYADVRPVSSKARGKAKAQSYLDPESDDGGDVAACVAATDMAIGDIQPVEDGAAEKSNDSPPTYVFTFDSLGRRHPGAGKKLGQYLHLEAHDKKRIDTSALSPCQYMVVQVPTQPNSCDCGVYLLHFAKQFMKNAEEIITHTTTEQGRTKGKSAVLDQHWDSESINYAREELKEIIQKKSAEWFVARTEKQANTERAAAGTAEGAQAAINIDDSDDSDDIQVLEGSLPMKGGSRTRESAPVAGVKTCGKKGR